MPDLPNHWKWTTIGEIAVINHRDPAIHKYRDDLSVTFVPMAAVDAVKGTIIKPEIRQLRDVRRGFTQFSENDVLLAKITPSMENGKAAIAKGLSNGFGFGSTEFHVIKPTPIVLPEWIFYFIRQERFRHDAKANFAGTAGQLRVPAQFLLDYPIPLPPLPEQRRIVAKIEELFTQLDAGVAALERTRSLLRRYRQAVLKAAVTGELTRKWREAHKVEIEPTEEGIKRKFNDSLPLLPFGWRWTTIDQLGILGVQPVLTGPFGTNLSRNDFQVTGVPVITIGCLTERGISLEKAQYISPEKADELEKYRLMEGDMLFSRMASVGRAGYVGKRLAGAIYNYHIMRLRLDRSRINSKYYFYYIQGSEKVQIYLNTINHGATRDGINTKQLMQMPIALPPLKEQEKIVDELYTAFKGLDLLENQILIATKWTFKLRQSILLRAFSGHF